MSLLLAIDPGPKQSAYMIFNGEICSFGIEPNEKVLEMLRDEPGSQWIAIEMIASYGMPVGADIFETCVWIGRFMEAAGPNAEIERMTRNQVKNHVCNSSKAKDSNIRQALIDRFGEAGTKKNPGPTYGISKDVWAALAVAVTAYDKNLLTYAEGRG
jgi:hypothetical protein